MAPIMVSEKPTLSLYKRSLLCVREYFENDLIDEDDAIIKSEARKFHQKHLVGKYGVSFNLFLWTLLGKNIIMHPNESGDSGLIVFKEGKLDLILDGQDSYIAKGETKFRVSQDVAFRPTKPKDYLTCTICNKTFGSVAACEQHNRDKEHVNTKLKKQISKSEDYDTKSGVIVEYMCGTCNAPETIIKDDAVFQIILVITNQTAADITIQEITHVNQVLASNITIVYHAGTIVPARGSYNIKLDVRFNENERRSYKVPLLVNYTAEPLTCSAKGLIKLLNFERISDDYAHLQPTSPYRRANPVASDMDETIIPGEKPDFQTDFKPMVPLQYYPLTKDYIQIFNSGLKSEKVDPRTNLLLKQVKGLLDVEKPMHCLTQYNYREMLELLLYLEEHQMQIDIRGYDTTTRLQHIRGNLYELEVPDLSESRPSLIVGDSVYVKVPKSETKYEGFVHMKMMDRVHLGFNAKFKAVFVPNMKFEVSFGYNRTTLKLEHQAATLANLCSSYFFPKSEDIPKLQLNGDGGNYNWYNRKLTNNVEQQQAVKQIVKGTAGHVPYLIFGPPGTGKTLTIVEAILQVHKQYPDKKILVCTPSNNAANLVNLRLLEFSAFSRKEMLRYVSYSFPKALIPEKIKPYCNLTNDQVCHPTLESMKTFQIVITTLVTAGRMYNSGIPADHFQYVFIDESGHATETETLIPITSVLLNSAKNKITGQIVLAGDPEQLGPIIHSTKAKEYGFGVSMLERLMTTNSLYQKQDRVYDNRVLTKLLKNYRSHPEIIALSNKEFYEGELLSEGNEVAFIAVGHEILPNPQYPLIFHSVLGSDQRESNSPSFFNVQEIATVVYYLTSLIGTTMSGRKIKEEDIAIITPYRKQVQKLRQQCKSMNYDDTKLMIGSIEQLQGQERLIVIISTVRAKPEYVKHDEKFHLGFLKNPKRFNVALTRAKALLIVIGNPSLLKHDKFWRLYIQQCIDNNAYTGPIVSMDIDEVDADLLEAFENITIQDDVHFGRGNQ